MRHMDFRAVALVGMFFATALQPNFCLATLKALPKADYIVVEKEKRLMKLLHGGREIRTYRVALGKNPIGPKKKAGDLRTPEGKYVVDFKRKQSHFHLALHISYPNTKDKRLAKKQGVLPGGDIMIHGLRKGWEWLGARHTMRDWTAGCIAVTNTEIEEIWKLVKSGTVVEIRP